MPNLSSLKIIIELFVKMIQLLKKKKLYSIIRDGLILATFIILAREFYFKNRFYENLQKEHVIYESIFHVVKACGQGSFVSWLVVNDAKANFNYTKVSFKDVIGCLNNNNCPASVKWANSIYSDDYQISFDDSYNLKLLPDGVIVSCNIFNGIPSCPKYTPLLLKDFLSKTNLSLSNISYILVRDWKKNLIYIFSLSFSDNSKHTCSSQVGNTLLENVARTAKENL